MLNTEDARRLLAIARRAASEAAAAVRAEPAPHLYTGTVNEGGDRVLVIDLAADRAIHRVLHEELAANDRAYAVLSEESGVTRFGGDYPLFVIDPVDGSAQARRRHPDSVVSIAVALGPCMRDLVAGVVQPLLAGEQYHALLGGGARYGEARLPLTPAAEGSSISAMLEGGLSATAVPLAARFAAAEPDWQLHISGAIGYQLALLGSGSYDVLVASRPGAAAYDIAAGWLIVREAGMAYADIGGLKTEQTELADMSVRHHPAAARNRALLEHALMIAAL